MKLYLKYLSILMLFAFSYIAIAHLEGGEDKIIDGYLIDFGYEPTEPQANQKTVFAINLVNDTTREVIDPSKVWVRISSSKDVIFAGTFKTENENVAFTFTFPDADTYVVKTRFFEDKSLLVEVDFEIKVTGEKNFNQLNIILLLIILIILIFIFKKFLFKRKNNK